MTSPIVRNPKMAPNVDYFQPENNPEQNEICKPRVTECPTKQFFDLIKCASCTERFSTIIVDRSASRYCGGCIKKIKKNSEEDSDLSSMHNREVEHIKIKQGRIAKEEEHRNAPGTSNANIPFTINSTPEGQISNEPQQSQQKSKINKENQEDVSLFLEHINYLTQADKRRLAKILEQDKCDEKFDELCGLCEKMGLIGDHTTNAFNLLANRLSILVLINPTLTIVPDLKDLSYLDRPISFRDSDPRMRGTIMELERRMSQNNIETLQNLYGIPVKRHDFINLLSYIILNKDGKIYGKPLTWNILNKSARCVGANLSAAIKDLQNKKEYYEEEIKTSNQVFLETLSKPLNKKDRDPNMNKYITTMLDWAFAYNIGAIFTLNLFHTYCNESDYDAFLVDKSWSRKVDTSGGTARKIINKMAEQGRCLKDVFNIIYFDLGHKAIIHQF